MASNNFLKETLNNLDNVDMSIIFNEYCLTLLHEIDKIPNAEFSYSVVYLPISNKENYTEKFVDYVIYLYSKYEKFKELFVEEILKSISDECKEGIFDAIVNMYFKSKNEKYINFALEIIHNNDIARHYFFEHCYFSKFFMQNGKLIITHEQKQKIFKYLTDDFNKIDISDVIPTEEDVQFIIEHKNFESYKFLVDNDKIRPITKHLEILLGNVSWIDIHYNGKCDTIDFIVYLLNHKVIPNRECLNNIFHFGYFHQSSSFENERILLEKIINMFYDIGINLSCEELNMLTQMKITIENFSDYDLLNDSFFIDCVNYKFYPPYLCKYKPNMTDFYYIFSCTKINDLPDYVQCLITSCDLTCLRLALEIPDNLETIKFILEKNIDTNIKTIREIIGKKYNEELKDVLRKYN
jgi:hypothetical protein